MIGVLIIRGQFGHREMYTGRTPYEDEGRDLKAKKCQKLLANHQKLRERQGDRVFSQFSEGTNAGNNLILGF